MGRVELLWLDRIQTLRADWLDAVIPFVTRLGDDGLLWIALAVLLLCWRRFRRAGIAMSIALLLVLLCGNLLLKPLVARVRPFDRNTALTLLIAPPSDYSFPSGHTAASFAAAFSLLFCGRRLWWAAMPLAALIAFSRLYLYVHYPTDILGGLLLGLIAGYVGARLSKALLRRFDRSPKTTA